MKDTIIKKLACPVCTSRDKSDNHLSAAADTKDGKPPILFCDNCKSRFTSIDGILNLASEVEAPKLFSSQWAMEFEPLVAAYDNIWRPTITYFVCDLKWEMEMSLQLMNLSSGMDVLDLACGTGNFTQLFSDPAKPGVIIGVDLSLPMLKQGMRKLKEQKNTNIMLMRVDVTKWPFAPETFDRIHCAGALHLFPDIQSVFISIYRSLKKGGYFVGATYCRGGDFTTQMLQKIASNGQWIHWFDQQELQKLSTKAGFVNWEERTFKQGIVFRVQKNGG